MLVGYYPINRGGAEYQSYLIAQEFKKKYDVFYISVGHDDDKVFDEDGFRIYTMKAPSFFVFNNLYFLLKGKIFQILQKEKPDVVYQRVGYSATGIASKYCKNHNSKMIWHIANRPDAVPFQFKFSKTVLFDYVEKKFAEYGMKNTNYIIAQTEYQNELLKKNYRRSCDIILPNFHPNPEEKTERKMPVRVVWVSNIKRFKQPEMYVNLADMFRNDSKVEFVMIGRSGLHKFQQTFNEKINKLKQFNYKGELPIEEVNRILAESHILINTSLYEGFPNTFIQAWMRKVPVISLNVDPDDIIKDNKIGFHSNTFEQLVTDTKTLIENNKLREEMGERAQKIAFEKFSMKNIEKIINLIEYE